MNTVLDDNMTLCLANGQRIKLKYEMKCLFEVNDLAVASPATVSRIGVVYMTQSDLGWLPYVRSWIQKIVPPLECGSWVSARLILLFEKAFTKGVKFQRKFCKEPVETVDIQLAVSLCSLFESIFTVGNGIKMNTPQSELTFLLDKLFFFCYVWSVGASCCSTYWEIFNDNTREIFDDVCPLLGLPGNGSAFGYYVDIEEGIFRKWNDVLPSFEYDFSLPYFSLIVPTIDTCRFSFIMKTLLSINKPCFITGITGKCYRSYLRFYLFDIQILKLCS